ncbi:hypothetical protein NQ315_010925 [Exocentrus adspersus]|uniref:acid phosphatase n=1 Tax=Exocentrus adspersus TaxID=1586481 RepID=A0AAV8VQ01_9CUCU|nr:hypothetical protein NQ315_010925 [Exocentrus adspersus]
MKAATGVLALVFMISRCTHGYAVESDGNELVLVAVLYRDGDKTPTSSFPKDPYFDLAYWPMGFGQVTEQGKLRQYRLGQWLRERYSGFLPDVYNVSDIYVRSTDTDRALISAQANLAGLYPPIKNEKADDVQLPQYIPIHTLPTNEDQVLYMERPCPKFYRLYDEVKDTDFFKNINKDFAEFYDEVSKVTGWQIDDVDYFYSLQSVLNVYANVAPEYLPSWYQDLDKDKVQYLAGLSYARYTFTDDLKRLGDGPFFDHLLNHFDKIMDKDQPSQKFLMMSAHSATISSVLNGLRLFDYKQPEFASVIIWELRKGSDGGYYINMFYRRNAEVEMEQLKLSQCSSDCKYQTFRSIVEPLAVELGAWDLECQEQE